jgi:glycosyltransferase involved in cell wall biosynthesis
MKLSIIVCTRNRARAILPCLDSIAAALTHAAQIDAEIIVVDNGSQDDTAAIVRKWIDTCVFPARLLQEPRKGVSRARNLALREARGDLLAIIDDDCRLSREYVTDLLRHDAEDTEPVLRSGCVKLGDLEDLPLTITFLTRLTRWHKKFDSARHENLGNCLLGCNMMMRRSLATHIGLFDERLGPGSPFYAAEDTDYVLRAYLNDITIEYVPDMVVFHHHGRKLPAEGKKLYRGYMISCGALYAKYMFAKPDFCRPLYWDAKNAVAEIFSGTNTFLPFIGFSHKDKFIYSLWGALKFWLMQMTFLHRTKAPADTSHA